MWDLFHLVTLEFAEDQDPPKLVSAVNLYFWDFLGRVAQSPCILRHICSSIWLHRGHHLQAFVIICTCFSRFPSPCGQDMSEAVDLFLAHTEKRLLHMTSEGWMTPMRFQKNTQAMHFEGKKRSLHHSIALFPTSIKQQVNIKSMLTTITSNPQSKCVTL